jgi:hypothetical protein
MKRDNVWVNKDGLVVGFGTREVDLNNPAHYNSLGGLKELVIKLSDLTLLGTDAEAGTGIYAPQYFANAPKIPAGATIQEVRITTDVAATSAGAADLLIGAYTVNDTTGVLAAVDADGLAAAGDSALTDFSDVGETIVLGKAAGAALVGKVNVGADPVVIAATYVTAAYTAGALSVHVLYSQPAN